MANTDFITFKLTDIDGQSGTLQLFVPTGGTIAQLQTLSDAFAAVLDDVTAAIIEESTVTLQLTLPGGLDVTPANGHYIQHGANFGFDAADTPYRHTIRVPAILESLLTGDVVETGSPPGSTFVNGITGGFGGLLPSDRYGNDLTALLSALRSFRKR